MNKCTDCKYYVNVFTEHWCKQQILCKTQIDSITGIPRRTPCTKVKTNTCEYWERRKSLLKKILNLFNKETS